MPKKKVVPNRVFTQKIRIIVRGVFEKIFKNSLFDLFLAPAKAVPKLSKVALKSQNEPEI
jgi:hypothetical protein